MTDIELRLRASVVESDAQGGVAEVLRIEKIIELPFLPIVGMYIIDGDKKHRMHNIEFDLACWDKKKKKITVDAGVDTIQNSVLDDYLANGWGLIE